ncbi:MAG TPA: A/G-specific adenine glycosylase, partial [Gemmatimonadota bacterium]|nr:A/G-specific adenine glycosylase [Gemmatimonadota bacterium]
MKRPGGAPIFAAVTPHIDDLSRALLTWFDSALRDLPWRRDRDPYRVWISEIMLQQTRVETVIPRFERWLARFPTLESLAEAEIDEVLAEWEGLGYYSRARNLHAAARIVRERPGGGLPDTVDELRELPGVGEYTAGAVASIAFDRPEPAIDVNARRVLARLFDLADPPATELRKRALPLIPRGRPGDFNQALIELGATVCLARSPRCDECPLEGACLARRRETVAERPGGSRRPAVPSFGLGVAVVVSPTGRALMVRRSERGMLGGMWEFPARVVERGESAGAAAERAAAALLDSAVRVRPLAEVPHAYSHRRHVYRAFLFDSEREAAPDPAAVVAGGWTAAAWEE